MSYTAHAGVRAWLEAAFAQVCEEQPADPYRALAEKCEEKGIKTWMDQAFAEIIAEQPADPKAALAEKCQRKSEQAAAARAKADAAIAASASSSGDFGTGETVVGEANGYGTVAVDLAAEAQKVKDMKAQGLNPDGTPYVHLPGNNEPPP